MDWREGRDGVDGLERGKGRDGWIGERDGMEVLDWREGRDGFERGK